jgi:tyrosinase
MLSSTLIVASIFTNSGYFLTWHRYFTHLFEKDLRTLCGYTGRYPYWNFGATASDLRSSAVFDGSEYSMSGDGQFVDSGDITLGSNFTLPHGTGGGCVSDGPFANLSVPMKFIPSSYLLNDTLPGDAFALNPNCLSRDLNVYVASTYTNSDLTVAATHASDGEDFELALNGIIGQASLGIHSGAHFQIGGARGQMSSIHVSAQDPIWYPMHTFVDLVHDSWQKNNPDIFDDLSGTMTAGNVPPSNEVTLDSILPDWGYLEPGPIYVRDLLNTTAGPFCYTYDVELS